MKKIATLPLMRPVCWLLLCIPALGTAQIYKWVDKTGLVHYADAPQPGATLVPIKNPPDASRRVSPAKVASRPTPENPYPVITLLQPTDGATLRHPKDGIRIQLAPELRKGDSWQILVDGNIVDANCKKTTCTLHALDRGEHTLQAQVVGTHRHVLASSDTITVYVHQASLRP